MLISFVCLIFRLHEEIKFYLKCGKKIYIKNNLAPFELSRTKIDLYFDHKNFFFYKTKKGIRRPH